MSNRLFQGIIHQMHEITGRTIGVIDESGSVVFCSELGRVGESISSAETIFAATGTIVIGGSTYRCFGTRTQANYAVFVDGEDDLAEKYAGICCISLENIKQYFDEKFDRTNFVKNVILENILAGDIYVKSRELRFNNDVSRAVLLVRLDGHSDSNIFDAIQALFPDKAKDFVISINEADIAVVKEVKNGIESRELEKLARSVSDSLAAENHSHVLIGIGTAVENIKDLSRSFREARVALEVGKVFDTEKTIVSYDNLGIARLIYQLPTTLCEMFLHEVFKKGSIESLDQETLFTIQKFFENNLNVSETSRKLFVHRNTLVYRLEKIKKLTGLDLRGFDDAIVFKVALMVKKYLDSKPVKF